MKKTTFFALIGLLTSSMLFAQSNKTIERKLPFLAGLNHAKGGAFQKGQTQANALTTQIALPKQTVFYDWNENTGKWDIYPDKVLNTYNANGSILSTTYINVDSASMNKYKTINTFNSNGWLMLNTNLMWNTSTKNWDSSTKYIYNYDPYGNQTEYQSFDYSTGSFKQNGGDKQAYSYDTNNNVTGSTYKNWDDQKGAYVNSSKGIYTLDANGEITDAEVMTWDTSTTSFVKSYKNEGYIWYKWNSNIDNGIPQNYTSLKWNGSTYAYDYKISEYYNTKGNFIEGKYEGWDTSNGKWSITSWTKYAITYDSEGNISESQGSTWDTTNSKWQVSTWTKYALTYNGSDLTQRIRTDWDNFGSGTFKNSYKEVYSDFYYITSIAQLSKTNEKVSIYPNPFTSTTNLRISTTEAGMKNYELKIYDITGKAVHTQTLNTTAATLNLNLPAGIYFYQVNNTQAIISTGKLMVQ
ncbi:MAG: T9SS type A sorting domain-containing protein [Bacteroidetes bacterium]|nr:T9SS type A sorting domain-containing protein [Bacteroidota bacterium]